MSDDDNNINTVPYDQPVDITGATITWDDNPASLAGVLHEASKFYQQNGLFQPLIQHGGVVNRQGKLALEHPSSVTFITAAKVDAADEINGPRNFEAPALPGPLRFQQFLAKNPSSKETLKTQLTDDEKLEYTVAPFLVQENDSKFLSSLKHIIKHSDRAEELMEKAAGSGRGLIYALKDVQAEAIGRDRAVISTEFTKITEAGVKGELTLASIKEYSTKYNKALRNMSVDARPKDESAVEMWSTIAYKDPELREAFEHRMTTAYEKAEAKHEVVTGAQTLEIIKAILRGRGASEKIDQMTSGGSALAAKQQVVDNLDAKIKHLEALAAQVEAKANLELKKKKPWDKGKKIVDPAKNAKKAAAPPSDADGKVKPPRGSDGRITHWIPGMDPCVCGKDHLFRDCEDPATKAKFQQEAKLVESLDELDELQCGEAEEDDSALVLQQLNTFLASASPAQPGGEMALAAVPAVPVVPVQARDKKCIISYPQSPVTRVPGPRKGPRFPGRLSLRRAPDRLQSNSDGSAQPARASAARSLRSIGASASNAFRRGLSFASSARSTGNNSVPVDTDNTDSAPAVLQTPAVAAEHVSNTYSAAKQVDTATAASATPSELAQPTCNQPTTADSTTVTVDAEYSSALLLEALAIETPYVASKPPVSASGHRAASGAVEAHSLQNNRRQSSATSWANKRGGIYMNVDSGCSGSLTYDKQLLVNLRKCDERFRAASGAIGICKLVGDMPILVKLSTGEIAVVTIKNVRYIPEFKYTLLSVDQLWREQKIDSVFGDTRALVFPNGEKVNYATDSKLGVIRAFSAIVAGKALLKLRDVATSVTAATRPAAALVGEHTPAPAPVTSAQPRAPPQTPQTPQSSRVPLQTPAKPPTTSRLASRLPSATGAVTKRTATPGLTRQPASARPQPATGNQIPPAVAPATGHERYAANIPLRNSSSVATATSAAASAAEPSSSPAPTGPPISTGRSSNALGFHQIGATSHIARLPAVQAAEVMHRRSHAAIDKIRAAPHTTSDAPKNLASAPAVPPCVDCAASAIKKTSHSGSLSAPSAEPGTLHIDLKEFVLSKGGYRYALFATEEVTRFVFVDFLKLKSEAPASALRAKAGLRTSA